MSRLTPALLDDLRPSTLWPTLERDTREQAARALYESSRVSATARREADLAVATAIRFRAAALRQLSVERRVGFLLRAVRPNDSLAGSLLLALHLEHRDELLGAFLDELGIAHHAGMIAEGTELAPFAAERLGAAAGRLFERFPAEDVELYLASLVALDPEIWGGLRETLAARSAA